MTEKEIILEDIKNYKYQETVFVFGDLIRYVQDLERYFRESWYNLEGAISYQKRSLDSLIRAIEYYEKSEYKFFNWTLHQNPCPFIVDETNYEQACEWLEERIGFNKKRVKAQRINQGNLMNILFDGKEISSLDLTNYGYSNHIIRIKYLTENNETIRMRVFFDESSKEFYQDIAKGFAQHANHVEEVSATYIREENIDEESPSLEPIYFISGKFRKSKLKIKEPIFEINQKRNKIQYSYQLNKAEIEMLILCNPPNSFQRIDALCYKSNTWSPYQGRKIIKNLFGILGVEDRYGWYSDIYLDERNSGAVEEAVKNGNIFKKNVRKESLPVLAAIYDRTIELKQKYGNGFYPRFSITEVSKKTGLNKDETISCLNDLVGVLTPILEPYTFGDGYNHFYHTLLEKYFISKSRIGLVERILNK